ncbi:hypothetical protein ABES03_11095 [Neobacillus rhizosphaerae]|uniref:hypothetical protein n=1 Tax=Neobacillus rhizosphaerae TaxID=2880965 RepID=UPI003D273E61
MVFGAVIGALVLVGIVTGVAISATKDRPKLAKENIPERLGVLTDVPVTPLLAKLDSSLNADYIEQVKYRFLQEHPKQNEDEFEWRLFELKRYFLLSNMLKETPMFSAEVDEVWHTMLLFTQKYQTFSDRFVGRMLHHTPNTKPTPAPQERAFFDWVFSHLFTITEYSWKSWGNFFRYPLDQKVLQEFKEESNEWLINRYFKMNEDNRGTVEYLVMQMKHQVISAEETYHMNSKGQFTKQRHYGEMTNLGLAMVFFSSFYFDNYWKYASEYTYAKTVNHTSGCSTAVFCGTSSYDHDKGGGGHHDGGHHGGGHDGGSSCSSCSSGSSCSSCGSGCSS